MSTNVIPSARATTISAVPDFGSLRRTERAVFMGRQRHRWESRRAVSRSGIVGETPARSTVPDPASWTSHRAKSGPLRRSRGTPSAPRPGATRATLPRHPRDVGPWTRTEGRATRNAQGVIRVVTAPSRSSSVRGASCMIAASVARTPRGSRPRGSVSSKRRALEGRGRASGRRREWRTESPRPDGRFFTSLSSKRLMRISSRATCDRSNITIHNMPRAARP